jgi:hypothetical protein
MITIMIVPQRKVLRRKEVEEGEAFLENLETLDPTCPKMRIVETFRNLVSGQGLRRTLVKRKKQSRVSERGSSNHLSACVRVLRLSIRLTSEFAAILALLLSFLESAAADRNGSCFFSAFRRCVLFPLVICWQFFTVPANRKLDEISGMK